MSRLKILRKYLSFSEALEVYRKLKFSDGKHIRLHSLQHPFSMRNNPFYFATFEEVILKKEYNIDIGFTPATIIDAGANIGLTSLYFANRFPSANIVALEPDAGNFELLKANTSAYKNIHPLLNGLWKSDVFLTVVDEGHGHNAFTVKEATKDTAGAIYAVTIPSIMKQQNWDHIDILKIDIEGCEKVIFSAPDLSWLAKVSILIIELHDRMMPGSSAAVFRAIGQYNFSLQIKGENLVFTNMDN